MRDEGVELGVRSERRRASAATDPDDNVCTLFGLLPLALGLGAGSELQRPLALAVIGGLILSTPITLFAVPTLLVAIRGPTTGCGDVPGMVWSQGATTTPHPGAEIMRLLPTITLVAALSFAAGSLAAKKQRPAPFQTASCPKRDQRGFARAVALKRVPAPFRVSHSSVSAVD